MRNPERPLRVAVFLGAFPVVSETFILRQITGLLDRGLEVDIYAETRAAPNGPLQPEVLSHRLDERVRYLDLPPEVAPWELPAWPITGETWIPGASKPVANRVRLARAIPVFCTSVLRAPRLTFQSVRGKHYQFQANSLSALYRVARLSAMSAACDVVHIHFGPVANSYRFLKRLWRVPLIASFHGYDVSTVPRRSGPDVYRDLFGELDVATVNSDFMATRVKELGCPEAKLRKLAYGIDSARFAVERRVRAANQPFRVMTVARLTEKKGVADSLRSFAAVWREHPEIRYDIVGDGPLMSKLQQLVGELGLGTAVVFHGALEGNAVRQLLSAAHAFVLASVTASDGDQEGTPVSLLEAQASGLPVLSTQHSGIPEIVRDGETGFLVPEHDTERLAERLKFLVEHPETGLEMGHKGRRWIAAEFDDRRVTEQLIDIYRHVIEMARTVD